MPSIISDPTNWSMINVKKAYYAVLTNDPLNEGELTPTPPVYSTPKPLINVKTLNVSSSDASSTEYYDGAPKITVTSKSEKTVALTRANITTDEMRALLGLQIDQRGLTVESKDSMPPYVALGFVTQKSNGGERYMWLLKGKFFLNEKNAASQEQTITMQNQTINGTFIERQCDGQISIVADTDDPDLASSQIFENWFKSSTLQTLIEAQ